ncbi:MAG: PKD domain-containing protein, partial [Thermoplasmata archaeon]
NPNDMENASWDVKSAICIDALSENRTFLISTIHENVHVGTIKTTGASSDDADRDLGDFFTCDVDNLGRLVVTYGMDGDDGPNARQSAVMFGKQIDGPFLIENTGPIANFTYETEQLLVRVDASESVDLNGKGITDYIWDWGDGTNSSGSETTHFYNQSGTYDITLKVINEDGQGNKTTKSVTVSEMEEEFNVCLPLLLVVVVAIVAAVAYRFAMKQKRESKVDQLQTQVPVPVEAEVQSQSVPEPQVQTQAQVQVQTE